MQEAVINDLFKEFVTKTNGRFCYMAGLPHYNRNFSRDTIISGIIATDQHLLENQLLMSLEYQGRKSNSIDGEELGKIHHEYPGFMLRAPYLTTYNACDTTALYLIGLEILKKLNSTEETKFLDFHRESILRSINYIQKHIEDELFWEYPVSPAKHFSLRATYWKDSIPPVANSNKEQGYPVCYSLVQFQVARGLLAAGRLLNRVDLIAEADKLFKKGIKQFITPKYFCPEAQKNSKLKQVSSDELHALAYIPIEYASLLPFSAILRRAKKLETDAGFTSITKEVGLNLVDQYHGYKVWIFEQALIHYGCNKFGLEGLMKIAGRSVKYIDNGNEQIAIIPKIQPAGNSRQLWSIAAKIYFSRYPSLRTVDWL